MEKEILDYVLVPLGILVMVAYHIWLLRQIICRPATTVIGINAINRRLWVRAMMEVSFISYLHSLFHKEKKRYIYLFLFQCIRKDIFS